MFSLPVIVLHSIYTFDEEGKTDLLLETFHT